MNNLWLVRTLVGQATEDELDRFWSKVWPEPMSGCFLWTASFSKNGYPAFWLRGQVVHAHRQSYLWYIGPLPSDVLVCHTHDNPECVRPTHLFPGSIQDNNLDRALKGRTARITGISHVNSKFTAMEVQEIRRLSLAGVPQKDLANDYGCAQSVISEIVRGISYA